MRLIKTNDNTGEQGGNTMNTFYQNREEEYSARLTINNTYPSHMHKQVELVYVTKGSIEVTIGEQTQVLEQGDMSVCFPSCGHSTTSVGDSSAILIIFNPEFACGFTDELLHKSPSTPFLTKRELPLAVTLAIKSIEECYARKKDSRIAQGLLMVILGNMLPLLGLEDSEAGDIADACKLVVDYVTANYANDISLDTVAKELGLSKYYISHIFSERINMSFPNYLGRCRAEHAAQLLLSTTMTVTDIGFASGFNSSRTFYRAFQNVYGKTPQEYRNSDNPASEQDNSPVEEQSSPEQPQADSDSATP